MLHCRVNTFLKNQSPDNTEDHSHGIQTKLLQYIFFHEPNINDEKGMTRKPEFMENNNKIHINT